MKKQTPPNGQNGFYFKWCSIRWFGLSEEEAEQLWLLRNAVAHNYTLNQKQIVFRYGHRTLVRNTESGYWEFYVHSMYVSFKKVKGKIYEHLSKENISDKTQTVEYLLKHGFYYTD